MFLVFLGRLLDNSAGAALVILALGALLVAAGTYGVRAHRSWMDKNGKNSITAADPYSLGGEAALLSRAVYRLDEKVTGNGGLQERIVRVEQTCERTEQKVDALPALMDSQTVEIRTHLSQEVFRAVRGLHDELAEEADTKIATALLSQAPAPKEPGA